MAPEIKRNKEFAKWLRHWIAPVRQNRPSIERTLREKTGSPDGKNILTAHTYLAQTCTPHPVRYVARRFIFIMLEIIR